MLELCAVLKISVTDLLCGEVVSVEQYNKQLEEKLLDMIKQKEENDKRLLAIEVVLGVLSTLILIAPIMAAGLLTLPDWQRVVLIFSGVIPAAIGFAFAMKIEQIAGYYECRLCGHRHVPTLKAMNAAMHMGRARYLRCPKCQRKSWQKKVIEKE
jgi:Zn finger protein HypA/HybF involved in hydrogenase expression